MNPQEILELPMQENDAKAKTIRGYLHMLLAKVWKEGECFKGKYPFGNSGWEYELYHTLIAHGAIKGEVDPEFGDIGDFDETEANEAISNAIDAMCGVVT